MATLSGNLLKISLIIYLCFVTACADGDKSSSVGGKQGDKGSQGNKGNKGGDGGTSKGGHGNIKNCPDTLKILLSDFLPRVDEIISIANNLKSDANKYSFRELKNFTNNKPIGSAYLHCTDADELMIFSEDKCILDGKTIDIKNAKNQCNNLRQISDAYGKFSGVDGSTARSALTAGQENDLAAYIKLIVSSFTRDGGA